MALQAAIANRPEIAEAKTIADRQDVEVDAARERVRPSLDLVASYAARGLAGDQNKDTIPIGGMPIVVPGDMLGGIADAYATLFTQRFVDATLGVTYTVPLGNRTAKGDLAMAQVARRQAGTVVAQVTQRVGVEVRNALAALDTAAQRIEAAQAGREAAVVQLQAEQDRFDAGLTTSFFVLTRQNDLAQAELAEIAARADYSRARAEYLRATGTLLGERGVSLDVSPGGSVASSLRSPCPSPIDAQSPASDDAARGRARRTGGPAQAEARVRPRRRSGGASTPPGPKRARYARASASANRHSLGTGGQHAVRTHRRPGGASPPPVP